MKAVAIDYLNYDGEWERSQLRPMGVEFVDLHPRPGEVVQYLESVADADVLVVAAEQIDRATLEALPRLRLIIRLGVGVDNVDVAAATERGVIVANMPGFCTREVAEHAVALLLACVRGLTGYGEAFREGRWSREAVGEMRLLRERTVGVVGCGRIGGEFLRLLRGWVAERLVYDPYISDARARRFGARRVSFEELLVRSDVISIHAPLTEETQGLFDRRAFLSMRKGAILINTARGPIVDEEALLEALERGTLAWAGLDVFEEEPLPPSSPLYRHPRIVATPHVAWYSEESEMRQRQWVVEDIRRFASGRRPQHVVNPEVYRRFSSGKRG